MSFQETITIINNSGKIISTGRHLVDILKGARATYRDRKEALKAARTSAVPGIRRAQTFDVVTPHGGNAVAIDYYGAEEQYLYHDERTSFGRRRSYDDGRSYTSSQRSHRSKRSHRYRDDERSRLALTESNLKAHSEVSSTTPSKAPKTYRSPYAETAPRDMALSRPTLHPAAQSMDILQQPIQMAYSLPQPLVHRPKKDIDMHLAYGNIPPDLATRVDLDISSSPVLDEEEEARTLLARVEALLDEAHCIQHTASAIIAHLQGNPEAAAAVALTLAELSTLLRKLSPSFLGIVKGGSPAVFALLASPQFLIAAGVAVGVTVVMFGGWKIVKKIREERREREEAALAFEMNHSAGPEMGYESFPCTDGYRGPGGAFDEALVLEQDLDEELSTIESWRRGIQPSFGEDESFVDEELISPEADRRRREDEEIHPDDSASGIGSRRSSKSHKSKHRSSHRSSRRHEDDSTDRKSSKKDEEKSESGSHRSSKSSRSKRTEKVAVKTIEDSKEKKPNMLKALFKKKKEKEDRERIVSVLV